MRALDWSIRSGVGLAMMAALAGVVSSGCLPDAGDAEDPSGVGGATETRSPLLPPPPGGGTGGGPQPCTPLCLACVADPASATGCSKPCRTNTCSFTTRVDCPASACPPPACAAGLTRCGTDCVDLGWDASNCGACGHACPAGGTCELGQCYPQPPVCGACVGGSQSCCQDTSSDQRSCWSQACTPPPCASGAVCAPSGDGSVCSCPTGQGCGPVCTRICAIDWTLCLLTGGFTFGLGCLPQCHNSCTPDSFCR